MHAFLTYGSIVFFVISLATLGGSAVMSLREVRAVDKRREREALEKRIRMAAQRSYWR